MERQQTVYEISFYQSLGRPPRSSSCETGLALLCSCAFPLSRRKAAQQWRFSLPLLPPQGYLATFWVYCSRLRIPVCVAADAVHESQAAVLSVEATPSRTSATIVLSVRCG